MPSCLYDFLILVLIPTALLICAENTFWDISRDHTNGGNFVELFKKSFTLYVESGMKEIVEIDIEILRIGHWQEKFLADLEAKDFNTKFYKFIVDHYLRESHCFYLH